MNGAPSVTFPVGRSSLGPALALATWLAGALTWAAWAWQAGFAGGRTVIGGVVLLACGGVAWLQSGRPARGLLDWDGAQWLWYCGHEETLVRVAPALDLQRWLLVRLSPAEGRGGPCWLWLARGADPEHWRSLRRAVYFAGPTEAFPEGAAHRP